MEIEQALSEVEKRFFELSTKVVKECGLSLYDMEYVRGSSTLRLFVMNKETGSAQLEDCVKVDHAMTSFIEEEDWMPDSLTLEVSSPGVYRKLARIDHFESAVGEIIALKLLGNFVSSLDKVLARRVKGKTLLCKLLVVTASGIEVEVDEKKYVVGFGDIINANAEPALGTF